MRRVLVFAVIAALGACFGYERPKPRSSVAIGAPRLEVGSPGLDVERRDLLGPAPIAANGESAGREKLTEIAKVTRRSADHVTLTRPTGDRVVLKIVPLTQITVNGRRANASALPEGAEVRASYVFAEGRRLAERIEVLSK